MELLAMLGVSTQLLFSFWVYGLVFNFLMLVILKYMIFQVIKTLEPDEYKYMAGWYLQRAKFMLHKNSYLKRLLELLMIFFPFYTAGLSLVHIFHILKTKGSYGIMNGQVQVDRLTIFQLVRYPKEKPKSR